MLQTIIIHCFDKGLTTGQDLCNALQNVADHIHCFDKGLTTGQNLCNVLQNVTYHIHCFDKGLTTGQNLCNALQNVADHIHCFDKGCIQKVSFLWAYILQSVMQSSFFAIPSLKIALVTA